MTIQDDLATARRGVHAKPWADTAIELDGVAKRLADEVERLTAGLQKANAQTEHFEREWYLRGDEIERLRGEVARLSTIGQAVAEPGETIVRGY